MSALLSALFIFGIYSLKILCINGQDKICGYNDENVICCSGYKKDEQGECNIPVCESDCGPGGKCLRPNTCYCSNGRVDYSCPEDNKQDGDEDQRKKEVQETCPDDCNGQGKCVGGVCECRRGYSGSSCLVKVIDFCYMSLSRGICQKTENEIKVDIEICCGAFDVAWGDPCQRCPKSRCGKGYLEVDGQCQDVNECTISGICGHGKCENSKGSYTCSCNQGFEFNFKNGNCEKIKDPCKQSPSVCGHKMKCVSFNTGKYICPCEEGYVKNEDRTSCVKKNQNVFNLCLVYGSYVCQYGKCVQDGSNYKCECNAGYRLSGDYKSCKKSIDYCSLYQNVLCPNGECISVNDDYMCKCNLGYSPSFNRKKCTSVCDLYPGNLCPNARCIPKAKGDYECHCNEGFSAIGKGKQCRRIMSDQSAASSNMASSSDNQASFDVDYCSHDYYRKQCQGGQCHNKKGSYRCECIHGYISDKNGLACKKIESTVPDQMLDMAGTVEVKTYCDKYGSFLCTNGHCVESGSSYQCRCNRGYKESSDGKICNDIDECANNPQICVQGTCTNSPGSYQCSCFDGFTIHDVTGSPKCYDRNECDEDESLCRNGQCINKWGSYACSCNTGFVISKDKKQCVSFLPSSVHSLDRKTSADKNKCKNCINSCKRRNDTYYQCECPSDQSPAWNTGLCAQMRQVVDIQFDMPNSVVSKRRKRSIDNIKKIFFELESGVDKDYFAEHVTSQYKNVVVSKCTVIHTPGKEGVSCSYYTN